MGYRDDYLPFCDADKATGELTGTLKDYLAHASNCLKNAAVSFEATPYPSTDAAFEAMQRGEIDCVFQTVQVIPYRVKAVVVRRHGDRPPAQAIVPKIIILCHVAEDVVHVVVRQRRAAAPPGDFLANHHPAAEQVQPNQSAQEGVLLNRQHAVLNGLRDLSLLIPMQLLSDVVHRHHLRRQPVQLLLADVFPIAVQFA